MLERTAAADAEMGADRRHAGRARLEDGKRLGVVLAWLDRDLDRSPGSVKGTNSGPSGPCATPSPCAPRRSILTSSSMAGTDQHFLVAAAAWNRGRHLGEHFPAWLPLDERPAPPLRPSPRALASRTMPPLPTPHGRPRIAASPGRSSQAPGAARRSAAGNALIRLMKLTSATMAPIGSLDDRGVEAPCVGPLKHHHARVFAELGCSWSLPTSTAKTLARPALEQNLGEATGRGADIEAIRPSGSRPKAVKRGGELEPAAGDEGRDVGA